ncbi:MAG: PEP-CTERM sorting domain-containing protein [Rhodoferax sp.]|nr:PEP-CTERM sorting domain-containing protein [Rhodoferax sp.]
MTLRVPGRLAKLLPPGHWTPVTAVPEPESYALMLAGLGLIGTIALRRSKASQST